MGWNHYCYNSYEDFLDGGHIYSLFVDTTVMLAQYVPGKHNSSKLDNFNVLKILL